MKTNFTTISLASILLFTLIFAPLSFIKAADSGVSLYVSPSKGDYEVNDSIKVLVKINTREETINAVKASLSFNENLEVKSISKSGSILTLWAPGEEPAYDNSSRKITFGGAGAGTTYKGSGGKLISITFKAKKAGQGTISFSSSSVKYGATTIDVENAVGGKYTIVSCDCGSWKNKACKGGSCSSEQRLQTRTCTPSKCASESRCIADSSCVSAPLPKDPLAKDKDKDKDKAKPAAVVKDAVKDENKDEKQTEEQQTTRVVFIEREAVQTSLLASLALVWGGTSQLAIIIAIGILSLIGLGFIGIKEWKLVLARKKKQIL